MLFNGIDCDFSAVATGVPTMVSCHIRPLNKWGNTSHDLRIIQRYLVEQPKIQGRWWSNTDAQNSIANLNNGRASAVMPDNYNLARRHHILTGNGPHRSGVSGNAAGHTTHFKVS